MASDAKGIVGREDLFITGKLWNTSHSPAAVQVAMTHSLRDLGLEYLDLYLVRIFVIHERYDIIVL